MKRLWLSGALLLSAVTLSACGGGGSDSASTATPTTPPVQMSFADRFGAGFGGSFRIAADAEPRNVATGDLDPVTLTAEPQPLQ